MQVQVAKAAREIGPTEKIHQTIDKIMSGEADPRAARAVLTYLVAQQRFVDAARTVGHLETQMTSVLNRGEL